MSKRAVCVSWHDAPHLSEDQKKSILAGIPPWQRDARSLGRPQLGAGAIYSVPESDFVVAPFEIPKYWPRSYGLDVGWNRTAASWIAQDRDTGTAYIYDEYYRGQAEPSIHAEAIKRRGKWIPGAVDPAARGRSQIDGKRLLELYADLGLDLEKADNAREAGIYAVWERFSTGTLKVFSSCVNTLSEYRLYRRNEKGDVVKSSDHLMDAIRYNIMSGLARAVVEPLSRPGATPWFHWEPPAVWSG